MVYGFREPKAAKRLLNISNPTHLQEAPNTTGPTYLDLLLYNSKRVHVALQ